jgi:hypothetical protein
MSYVDQSAKQAAYEFLKDLEVRLQKTVPPLDELRSLVQTIWQKPKHLKTEREKIESKENVPFFSLAVPHIFELGKEKAALDDIEMREAFR